VIRPAVLAKDMADPARAFEALLEALRGLVVTCQTASALRSIAEVAPTDALMVLALLLQDQSRELLELRAEVAQHRYRADRGQRSWDEHIIQALETQRWSR
jgi:hypothetical protein